MGPSWSLSLSEKEYRVKTQRISSKNSRTPIKPLATLLDYVTSQPWAMQFTILQQMANVVERHITGEGLTALEINAIIAQRDQTTEERSYQITNEGTAIIPVSGIIAKHSHMVNGVSQPRGTSIETLRAQLDEALGASEVSSILLDIESPGGCVDGIADFASRIYQASFQKPIIGFIDGLGASAAYWIASQANAIYASQAANVGGLGIYTIVVDTSRRAEALGLKFLIFRSGPHKGVGESGVEVTDENAEALQEMVQAHFEVLLDGVMRGRGEFGLTDQALHDLADGRTYISKVAAKNKLIDGIATFEEALQLIPSLRRKGSASTRTAVSNKVDFRSTDMNTKTISKTGLPSIDDGEAETYIQAYEELRKSKGLNKARAMIKAARDFPAAHRAWLAEQQLNSGSGFGDKGTLEAYEKAVDNLMLVGGLSRSKAVIQAAKTHPRDYEAWLAKQQLDSDFGDDGRAETYVAAYQRLQKSRGLSKSKSMIRAARELPRAHRAWLAEQQL